MSGAGLIECLVLDFEIFLEVLLMVGKEFCAALCASLAVCGAPKAEAVSDIAVSNYILGGIQSLVGAGEIVVSVLGFAGKATDIIHVKDDDFNLVCGILGLLCGIPNSLSGVNTILDGVTAGNNKKNAEDVKALKSDMKLVKEKLGITDNSEVKK